MKPFIWNALTHLYRIRYVNYEFGNGLKCSHSFLILVMKIEKKRYGYVKIKFIYQWTENDFLISLKCKKKQYNDTFKV